VDNMDCVTITQSSFQCASASALSSHKARHEFIYIYAE
jgi:hypothetical protein